MSSLKKVVLVGAAGSLGAPVLDALLSADFEVTVFTRPTSNSKFPSGVKHVAKIDYSNTDSLTSNLKGHDAVIMTTANAPLEEQLKLVDAAIAVGIKRIMPSEFGSDTFNPEASKLGVFKDKVAIHNYIIEKVKGTATSYTVFMNNAFLDWGIAHTVLIDLKGKKMSICDGGENLFSVTTLATVGKATAAVLQHPAETKNKIVKVQDAAITQNQLLSIVQRVVGSDGWTVENEDTVELVQQANKDAAEGKVGMPQIMGWLKRAIYGKGMGGHFEENDNEMLGVAGLDEKQIEDVVRGIVKGN